MGAPFDKMSCEVCGSVENTSWLVFQGRVLLFCELCQLDLHRRLNVKTETKKEITDDLFSAISKRGKQN